MPIIPCSAETVVRNDSQQWLPGALLVCLIEALFILALYAQKRKLSGDRNTLQNILDASCMVAIISTDKDGKITLFNEGAERMLGYSASEVVGKLTPLHFHVPTEIEDRERELRERFGRPIRGIEVFTTEANETGHEEREWTYVRKDGTRFPGYLAVTPITNGQDRITGMLGISLDISGHKRAEEALAKSEASLRRQNEIFNTLLDNMTSGVFMVEAPSGKPIIANQAAQRLLGRGILPDATKENLAEVYRAHKPGSTDAYPVEEMPIIRGMYGEESHVDDMIVERPDGDETWIEIYGMPIRDAEGRIWASLVSFQDITARKRAEEELFRQKAFIEAIFNSVPGMLYLYDYDGQIVRWNQKHEIMTGYNSEEMSRMRLLDWYKDDEKSQNAVRAGIQTTLETGFGEAEADLQRKDGTKIPMYFTASPMTLFGKQYFVGLGIDITARKQTERLMRIRLDLIEYSTSHTMNEFLQKTLDDVIGISGSRIGFYHFVDADQKTLTLQAWSTSTLRDFCKTEGYGRHYSVDKAGVWVDCVREKRAVVHNDYASLPHRKGLPEGHAPVIRELTVPVIKDDKIVAILGVGNKPSDYTDDDIQTISFLADVTWEIVSKQRAKEALRESETKLSALFAAMTEMVALHELVFDETGTAVNYRIVGCNAAFTRITGIRREDAVGKLANEVYGTGEPPYLSVYARVGITGEPYTYETYFPPMDKHFSISVVSPGKNKFATITTDISEIKRIQAAIDTKNKELEQIVYVASHDLRSPLVNVDGYSRELESTIKGIIARLDGGVAAGDLEATLRAEFPDMEQSIDRIRISAIQMDKLLKGLLHLSRQGRASLQIENIDMNACITKLISSFAFTLEELKIELTAERLPPCRGDAVQLTQVFSNLINNAIKYRDQSRPLKIAIRGSVSADRATYRVEDNGIGIAANHLEHVFELFHRLNPDKTDGEGIGLTIARQALSRMYGDIKVESELGKGSAFIVTMPPARGER
jgi:PAS domain S-box-containing protein